MPIRWNVPEHSEALQRITAALDAGSGAGAVVLGPDGCGKSTLARLAAEDHSRRHPGTEPPVAAQNQNFSHQPIQPQPTRRPKVS